MDTGKQNLLNCLKAFINQRPGLEFCNYGDITAYRSEMRSITKAKHEAVALLNAVAWRDSITAEDIIEASASAYSGRLTIKTTGLGAYRIDYCTGQYFPTEYRNAVCAVLSQCLWTYWRDNISGPALCDIPDHAPGVKNIGDSIRKTARKELGRGIVQHWFN